MEGWVRGMYEIFPMTSRLNSGGEEKFGENRADSWRKDVLTTQFLQPLFGLIERRLVLDG